MILRGCNGLAQKSAQEAPSPLPDNLGNDEEGIAPPLKLRNDEEEIERCFYWETLGVFWIHLARNLGFH